MTRISELAALVVALITSVMPAFAGDAKGWYEGCCTTVDFHIVEFPGRAPGEELRLRMHSGGYLQLMAYPDLWWSKVATIKGQRCTRADKCEDGTGADIQVLKATKRRITGKYVVDFNGQHFEGQFSVKYRKRHPQCICE